MKKNVKNDRVLGRRIAREMTREEMENANGGAYATWTLRYPADGPYADGGGSGPIWA